ncbi:universal stress protein [Pseudomonas sp. R-28-1W-6]|uniref:universal stress protein n=1 Tax=Pseudomonas sp. R-28-1W-6 TaxID=2650101 RepID=UPI00136594EA|nr:universal stress protein [Pseudomonas sp. R-28-1W-6]MWV12019.1 universal stress protein [Pseudomonas sp. R-28-1W-6]
MSQVMACIDASLSAAAVCDYAAWASLRLQAPLTLLHVLDHQQYPQHNDLTGIIGLGNREQLLKELAELDQQRNRLALEQGRLALQAAKERVAQQGVAAPYLRQRHGDLAQTLHELEGEIDLLVIGHQGETGDSSGRLVGSHLESVIRTLHRPILVCPGRFQAPRNLLLAFDGSPTCRQGVEQLASGPLCRGLPVHVLMVGSDSDAARSQLQWAEQRLRQGGLQVHLALRAGEVEAALHTYQREQGIDLLVMGAYGHSRIRQFLVGSTTTQLLRTSGGPLLILR